MTGISESVLDRWSNPGAQSSASNTYSSVQSALNRNGSPTEQKSYNYDIFLQGSYANSTNIYGNSDVDIVAMLDSAWTFRGESKDVERKVKAAYPDADHSWKEFRNDVISGLKDYYGSAYVSPGNKAIKIETPTGNAPDLDADVVAAQKYRYFTYFRSTSDHHKREGITFWTRDSGRQVINYPKTHRENGETKNQNTNEDYKPTVRMFKNARDKLVDTGLISKDTAPSFYVECLLYNVNNIMFRGSYQERFGSILSFLSRSDMSNFTCQNGYMPLFSKTNEDVWNEKQAKIFISQLIELWNNWGDY